MEWVSGRQRAESYLQVFTKASARSPNKAGKFLIGRPRFVGESAQGWNMLIALADSVASKVS